jgi:formyl-CoA transferase
MGLYPCKPGGSNDYVYLYVTRANNSHWHRLLKVIGREDLIDDERYDTPRKRFAAKEEVDALVIPWTQKRTKEEAMQAIGSAGIPCGAVYDTMEIYNAPHFDERGIFQHIDHPQRGDFKMAAWPVKMSGNSVPVKSAPLLGGDNENVLTEWLGLSSDDVKGLKDKGTLG